MYTLQDIEQSSDEWKAARAGRVTASRAKDARDKLKSGAPSGKQNAYAAQVALERIAGKPLEQVFETWQMKEGHVQEVIARARYESIKGDIVNEVGAISTDDDCFLYSPDGLVGDDGLIEIKTLFSPERICNIIGDGDYSDFADQCQFGLWITRRKWIDLVLWAPSINHLEIVRIDRNEAEIESLEQDMMKFIDRVDSIEFKMIKKIALNSTSNSDTANF